MLGGHLLEYALACALAIALAYAAWTDFRRREIDNWLNAAICLCVPLYWYSQPGFGLIDIAIQLSIAGVTFGVLLLLFSLGQMGGGDVKLLTALALWIWPIKYMQLLIIMAIAGFALSLALYGWHHLRRDGRRIKVPYGIAISFGGLWVLADYYLPRLQNAGLLG